jgi:hypothetical protein
MSSEHNSTDAGESLQRSLCADHPQRAAIGTCARCGNFYCGECAGRVDGGMGFCHRCHGARAYVAWEDASLGLWQRYFRTVKSSLVELPRFAAELPARGDIGLPLSFALLPTVASVVVGVPTVASVVIGAGGMSAFLAFMMHNLTPPNAAQGMPAGMMGAVAFLIYGGMGLGGYVAYLALWPAVLLAAARLFGNRELSYRGLFRILCYASGFNCLYFVPLLGMAVAVYHYVVASMCIASQGKTSVPAGFGLYGLPAVALGGCCCGSYAGLMFLAMRSGAS